MKMNSQRLLYISGHNSEKDLGVEKKIRDICAAARNLGYDSSVLSSHTRSIKARRNLLEQMLRTDAKYVILRSFNAFNIRCRKLLKEAKRQGRILVLDQPTPMSAYLPEVWGSRKPFGKKMLSALRLYYNGPWGQRVFDRIVQYGDESWFFSLGNKERTILIGNGIDPSRMGMRSQNYNNSGVLRLVGVSASVSRWHGFDRIIRAMGMLGDSLNVEFEVVGEDTGNALENLARKQGVESKVHFHGKRQSDYILNLYSKCNLAVSSLGLFRNGLETASVLKAREYCLVGIPFIAAGYDPDFAADVPFRFVVPNDDTTEPIVSVLKRFNSERGKFTDFQIREYALEHLSFESKIKIMLEGLV